MDRGALAEDLLQPVRIHRRDLVRVERTEPAPEVERAREGLLHGHLLVKDEPDEERERIGREESVGLGIAREK